MNNETDPGELEDDSDCADEPRDYSTPKSLDKQANSDQTDVSSESNQAATLFKTPSEPSQRRIRAGRATVLTERARENLQQTGSVYRASPGSNFAILPVFTSFYAGSTHRLYRRDLS
jgi:hypothetical protein